MKIHTGVLLAGLMSASLVCAENLTEANVERARAVIDAAVEAHGGEALTGLKTVVVEFKGTNVSVGQSKGAEKPWDRNPAQGVTAIDLENRAFVTRTSGSGGGFEFDNATIINADDSYQLNFRAGTQAKIVEPDFDTTSGPFMRVTPAMLVRQVSDRAQNAYYLGETAIGGQSFDVVGFSMAVGPAISLYFDKKTHLLRRSERVLPNVGLVEYEFTDYVTIAGLPFNRQFAFYLNGDENAQREMLSVTVDQPIDSHLGIDHGLAEAPPVVTAPLARNEIAEGVHLIGGAGTYAMFVEMDSYVIAVGGTAGIPDRIELLRGAVPDKPIRFGVMTHHHFDHVVGVSAYETEGATVVGASAHETVIREAAANGELLQFKAVSDELMFEEGGRRVEIIDIGPTAHTNHLLVAWLPEEGILFEADHFSMPQEGNAPPAVSSTKSFAAALRDRGLQPRLIASAHSPRPGTMQDLRSALERKVVSSGSADH